MFAVKQTHIDQGKQTAENPIGLSLRDALHYDGAIRIGAKMIAFISPMGRPTDHHKNRFLLCEKTQAWLSDWDCNYLELGDCPGPFEYYLDTEKGMLSMVS